VSRSPRPHPAGALGALFGRRQGGINFVSACRYSHSAPDDPIVFPGKAGASHVHDFFANTTTDASSTYATSRSGATTCRILGDTAAYWVPALYDSGRRVQPSYVLVYYTPGRKDYRTIQAFPAGLEFVAKDDKVFASYACVGGGADDRGRLTPPTCSSGSHLVIRNRFSDCWDGRHLDTADHTSHLAFAAGGHCPSSHPVPVPAISVNVHYPSAGGDIALGSPDMPVAAHADFFNAWDQPTLERLVRTCLNAGRTCGQRPPGT
jgi:hypothetical protein